MFHIYTPHHHCSKREQLAARGDNRDPTTRGGKEGQSIFVSPWM
jgi:hypothetical protein